MRKFTTLAMVAMLAACNPAADKAPVDADPVAPAMPEAKADGPNAATTAVSLDGDGLRFVDKNSGKTSLLPFGVPRAQAESALANVAGKEDDRSTNAECGAGSMEFTRYDAMTLNFQNGKFAGWFLGNEPGAATYSTMSGIGIGTTRAKASESVTIVDLEDSTLGEEFSIGTGDNLIGGMFAAPGDAAKIDALFAGTNCFFR
ncbi:Conserved Putative secreted protein [Sphingopyxis fribergensis]|uniref:Conserved Putative secreted protein n=1 Tax=Sphingopyxis fribergensis TaxID=1515612 RepID=A0A0A7PMP6_9SPHN|nr:hypothetical protein [Sphingopyxis fribergensis]AJA10498.1 Conserved Putative secreted protein [Sphingopyxis fribergensis]